AGRRPERSGGARGEHEDLRRLIRVAATRSAAERSGARGRGMRLHRAPLRWRSASRVPPLSPTPTRPNTRPPGVLLPAGVGAVSRQLPPLQYLPERSPSLDLAC